MLHLLTSILPLIIFDGGMIGEWVTILITSMCTGSIGWLASVKYNKQQAKADAMKSVQDVYQELMADLKRDRDELRSENEKLKETLNQMGEKIAQMQQEMEALTKRCNENERKWQSAERKITAMKPLICTVSNCPNRCSKES